MTKTQMQDPIVPLSDDRLLSHLYDAVMAPSGFQAFIDTFRVSFDLKSIGICIRHTEKQDVKSLWLSGMTEDWMSSYVVDYANEDMLAHHIMASPIARFYASNLDVPHPERFPETRFYRDWVAAQGMAYAAGAIVLQEGQWVTQLFLQRGPEHPPFSHEEMNRVNRLVPHLQRAIQMRQRFAELQLGQNFLAGGLDVLAMPTFLFNEYQRAIHYNRSATALLNEQHDLWLDGGLLQTRDRALTRKLDTAICKAIQASLGDGVSLNGIVLLPRFGRQPLMLMVTPLQLRGDQPTQGAALLFAFDPEATPSITADLVRQLFALSDAEAGLAVALCGGETLDDIAKKRGTSINTVKSQLKSIFLKTGTNRQSELVSLVLASPAYFLAQKQLAR
ncbi:helix-turn-helix transcriptional regulator [Neisseriaceae bacterium JH1-16]|nr:helix-turn-helix transcriptional regulator [Neisseriaceae bacterium JH1-16]